MRHCHAVLSSMSRSEHVGCHLVCFAYANAIWSAQGFRVRLAKVGCLLSAEAPETRLFNEEIIPFDEYYDTVLQSIEALKDSYAHLPAQVKFTSEEPAIFMKTVEHVIALCECIVTGEYLSAQPLMPQRVKKWILGVRDPFPLISIWWLAQQLLRWTWKEHCLWVLKYWKHSA